MRRLLIAVAVVAALGIAGLGVATALVARAASDGALAEWAAASGVPATVDGGIGFAFLPSPRAVARDVRLSVPGVAGIRVATLEIVADPRTVLAGRFVVAGVRAFGATVALADGGSATVPVGDVRVPERIEVVDGRLVLPGGLPDLPFAGVLRPTGGGEVSADLRLGVDRAIGMTVVAEPPAADGRRPVRVRAERGGDTVRFDGERADGPEGAVTTGRIAVVAPTLAQSLAALGLPPDLLPLRAADVTAALRVDRAGTVLDAIRGQLDIGDVAGSVRWGGDGLSGRIDAGRVPLDRLLPPALALARATVPVALDLRLAGLSWNEVELGIAAIAVRRADGALVLDLSDAALFDGSVAGRLAVGATDGRAPSFAGSVRLNGVDAERLLRAIGAGPAAAGDLRGVLDWRLPADRAEGAGGAPTAARLVGDGHLLLTGGRVGVGVFGLDAPLPLDGLSGSFAIGEGRATAPAIGLVSPPQRFAGRGSVDLASGVLDLAFAPIGDAEGRLPQSGFRLRGPLSSARIEAAPVPPTGPPPPLPARGERGPPPAPPTPLPGAVGRGG